MPLTLEQRACARLAALMAAMRPEAIETALRPFVRRGVAPAVLREAACIAALFCGFPAGVAALAALEPLGPGRRHRAAPGGRARARAAGERLFRRIHGKNAARQLELLERLHPDFAATVLATAYGEVLARPFLALATRELVGLAALAVLGLERQLRAHRLAAGNVGNSETAIRAVLRLAAQVRAGSRRARPAASARP